MNLYHDGVFQLKFEGVRSHERVVDFIKQHTEVSEPSRDAPPPELPEHDLQTPHSERNPHGEVLALTPETFSSVVTNGDIFVKFFAPWCVFLCSEGPKADVDAPWIGVDIAKSWHQLGRSSPKSFNIALQWRR